MIPTPFPVDQVVVRLHGDEPRTVIAIGDTLGLGELPGEHAAGADVASLACSHHIVQRPHGLLDRRPGIPPVDLIEIHVFEAQSGQ
jgi:hypothetical protein